MSGLLTVDDAGRVTSFNPEAERITGRARGDACGQPVEAILPGVEALVDPTVLGRSGGSGAVAVHESQGQRLHLGVGAYDPSRWTAPAPAAAWSSSRTLPMWCEMEDELRRSERLAAIGTLAASIAHEIRNPLAAISGSIQMLRARSGAGDRRSRRV